MLSRETERARAGLAYDLPWRGGHAALLPIATGAKRHCWCRTAAFVLPWNGRVTPSDRSPPRTAGAAPCDLTDARTSPHRNSPLWRSNAARPPACRPRHRARGGSVRVPTDIFHSIVPSDASAFGRPQCPRPSPFTIEPRGRATKRSPWPFEGSAPAAPPDRIPPRYDTPKPAGPEPLPFDLVPPLRATMQNEPNPFGPHGSVRRARVLAGWAAALVSAGLAA